MPMKNQGSVPQGKGQKKANQAKDKKNTRDLKGIFAKESDKKPGQDDPRRKGK